MHTPGGARFQVPGSDSRPVQPTLPSLRGVWIGTRPFWKGRNTDLPVDWPQQVIHCVSQILIQNCTHDIGVKCVPHPKKTNWIMRHLSLSLYVHIKQGLKADAPKHSVVALWIWRIQPGGGGVQFWHYPALWLFSALNAPPSFGRVCGQRKPRRSLPIRDRAQKPSNICLAKLAVFTNVHGSANDVARADIKQRIILWSSWTTWKRITNK